MVVIKWKMCAINTASIHAGHWTMFMALIFYFTMPISELLESLQNFTPSLARIQIITLCATDNGTSCSLTVILKWWVVVGRPYAWRLSPLHSSVTDSTAHCIGHITTGPNSGLYLNDHRILLLIYIIVLLLSTYYHC